MRDPELILNENPGSVVFAPYADMLARGGKIEQALDILRKGIQANPFYAPGYSILGDILSQQDSHDEAADSLRSALKNDPQRPRDLFWLGNHFLKSDPIKSRTFLWAARVFEPQAAQVTALYAQACESSGTGQETGEGEQAGISESESGGDVTIEEKGKSPEKPSDKERKTDEDLEAVFDDIIKDEITKLPIPLEEPYEEGENNQVESEEMDELEPPPEDRNLDVPPLVTGPTAEGGEEKYDNDEKEDASDRGISTAAFSSEDGLPLEFGVIDYDEKDSDGVKTLEINEEEEYDLSRFLFGTAAEDDAPVLSEQERKELMSLASSDKAENGETVEETEDAAVEPVLPGISNEDSGSPIQEGYYGRLSSEEIDILSTMDNAVQETDVDLERETREGIDYSDVLSTWTGKKENAALEPESAEIPLSATHHDPLWQEEEKNEEKNARGIEDESAGKETSSLPAMDTGWNVFEKKETDRPLTEDEKALIDDFVSGLEPELEIEPKLSEEAGKQEAAEPPSADSIKTLEVEVIPESSAAFDEDLKAVEDMNLHAPDVEILREMAQVSGDGISLSDVSSTIPKMEKEENKASLDSLINEYLKVLNKKTAVVETVKIKPMKPVSPLSTRKTAPVLEKERESQTGAALSNTGSYTATMAEIYVSQGLVSRAVEIYTVLLERDPGNEHIKSRLKELESLADLQGDIS